MPVKNKCITYDWKVPPLREGSTKFYESLTLDETVTDLTTTSLLKDEQKGLTPVDKLKRIGAGRKPHLSTLLKQRLHMMTYPITDGIHFQFKALGPGWFLLKDPHGSMTFTVKLFRDPPCTCGMVQSEECCVHTLFCFTKILGVPLQKVIELNKPLNENQVDRVLKQYSGTILPFPSGIKCWKRPVDLDAFLKKFGIPLRSLEDDMKDYDAFLKRRKAGEKGQDIQQKEDILSAELRSNIGGLSLIQEEEEEEEEYGKAKMEEKTKVNNNHRPDSMKPTCFYNKSQGLMTPDIKAQSKDLNGKDIKSLKSEDPNHQSKNNRFSELGSEADDLYEVPKLQPGFKIRSPQQVVAPRFHRELMQFLKLWEFIPPGKNRDYMGGQIKKCWDKHKAFRGWVRIIHDRNKKRANYIRKVRVTVNIIPPDSPTSFALILPLLTSVKEVKKQFVKRMTGQRQKTMKKALQDSLLIMKSIDGILMKDEETLFPMVKKNSTVKLQYI